MCRQAQLAEKVSYSLQHQEEGMQCADWYSWPRRCLTACSTRRRKACNVQTCTAGREGVLQPAAPGGRHAMCRLAQLAEKVSYSLQHQEEGMQCADLYSWQRRCLTVCSTRRKACNVQTCTAGREGVLQPAAPGGRHAMCRMVQLAEKVSYSLQHQEEGMQCADLYSWPRRCLTACSTRRKACNVQTGTAGREGVLQPAAPGGRHAMCRLAQLAEKVSYSLQHQEEGMQCAD